MGHKDDRVMDDRGQLYIRAKSHQESDGDLMIEAQVKNPGVRTGGRDHWDGIASRILHDS